MHLVAVNLWTWFRFVLAKEAVKALKEEEQAAVLDENDLFTDNDTDHLYRSRRDEDPVIMVIYRFSLVISKFFNCSWYFHLDSINRFDQIFERLITVTGSDSQCANFECHRQA